MSRIVELLFLKGEVGRVMILDSLVPAAVWSDAVNNSSTWRGGWLNQAAGGDGLPGFVWLNQAAGGDGLPGFVWLNQAADGDGLPGFVWLNQAAGGDGLPGFVWLNQAAGGAGVSILPGDDWLNHSVSGTAAAGAGFRLESFRHFVRLFLTFCLYDCKR